MFRWFRSSSAPDEIYSSCLQTLHLGHALWYPEPHESGEPQIGDVGFVHEGAFIRLFNLDTSAPQKEVKFWEPPFEITESLPRGVLKIDRRQRPLVPDHYCSHGVESKQTQASADVTVGANASATLTAKYTCKAVQGAILELKSEAYAETLFENQALEKYIVRNHDTWYEYATDTLGHRLKQENLVVVRGWVKTEADWAATAFSNTDMSSSGSVGGHAGGVAGMEVSGSKSRSVTGPRMQRRGQHYLADASRPRTAEPTRDQCVMVKRYKLQKRLGILKRLTAGAGHHRLPDMGDGGQGGSGEEGVVMQGEDLEEDDLDASMSLKGDGEVPDPLDILLDYMLETSNAETVIASDDDVETIIGGNHVVDFASYLRRVQPPVQVDGTLGLLCAEDVISHERERAFPRRTITPTDLAEWPGITLDSAGRPGNRHVFIGPTEADVRPLKLRQLTFADSLNPSASCKRFSLSSDGKILAASFGNSDVLVWRIPDGLLVQRLHHQGHAKPISSLAFSPDDRSLASGAEDGTVVIWDIRHGRALLRLEGHRGTVKRIVYAPHGALIATGSDYDHSVKIWDASTGTCLHRIGLARDLCQVAFSPNSSHLYIDQIGTCWIYETQTYTCIAELGPLTPGYHQLSVSRQGDRIVTTSRDGQVKIWSAVTGEELLTIDYPKGLWDPAILSPDGSEVLAACAPDGTAVTFDSWTGQLRRVYELPRVSNHVSYSLDGDCVAMEDIPGDLHVRDAKSGAFLAKFKALSRDAGFNDEPLFLLGNQNFMVHFSDGLSLLHNIQDMLRLR